jgi:hypothetical protein
MKLKLTFLLSAILCSNFIHAQPGSGQMLELNGSTQYVNCGSINNSGSELTMQGWVYVDQFKSSSPYISSMMGTETTGNQACIRFGDAGLAANKIQFVLLFGSTHVKLNGTTTLDTDRWYHIAATYGSSGMKIYINGVLEVSNSATGSFTSNANFALGRNYANSRILDGFLDEMSVFTAELSQTTIREWMCKRINSAHPNYASLNGYWTLDEGSGTTTEDMSGNSNDGTLVSSPSWENSGAPIGDRSKYIYASTYSIGISHPQGDSIHYTHQNGTVAGVHVYRVDSIPYDTNAPNPLLYLDSSRYWGIFPVGNSGYTSEYYYDGNSFLTSNDDCNIGFANRADGSASSWDNVNFSGVNYSGQIVTWTDSNQSESILGLSANGPHAFVFDHEEPNCFEDSDGSVVVHVSGGESPYSYAWANGSNDSTSTGLTSGHHVFTITDNNGCVSIDSTFLDEPTPVTGAITSTNATCMLVADGSLSVSATGGTMSGYSYQWSDAGNSTTATLTNLLAGGYTVTITDANGCEGLETFTLESTGPDPIPNLGPDTNVCGDVTFGMTADVTNGPASGFNWSTGETGPIKIVSEGGTYILTVTNNAGCSGIDTVVVTYVTPLQVELPNSGTGTGSYTINASAGHLFYEWSTSETGQSISVNTSGSYSVTATDSNGCQTSDTIQVTIKPAGISDLSESIFTLTPNPARDIIHLNSIENSGSLELQIFDLAGRVVYTVKSEWTNNMEINLSHFEAGKYIMRVHGGSVVETKSFVKL